MSIYSSGLTLGGGMAFIIGGLVVQWTHSLGPLTLPLVGRIASWQAPLLAMCVPGLVAAVLLFTVREPPRPQVAVGGDGPFKGRAVACYVMQNARPFGYITSGYALMVVVAVATVLWMPVFYMRVHGMAPGVFGLIYGGIYCLAGTGGLFAGGVISDWLAMRGKIEAPAYVVFWAILGSWPFYVGAFLVSSTTVSLLLVAIATFVLLLHGGLQGVTIQLIAPSRMRGRLAAAYLIIVNVVGMGLAPLLTAWFTEHVFGGPAGIGRSLALTVSLALPAGAALVRVGLPHVRELALSVNADGRAASIEGVGGRLVETEATL